MSEKPFAEIEQFDAKNLKHVETEEKNPLPSSEGERSNVMFWAYYEEPRPIL